jgi:hypothetical protein
MPLARITSLSKVGVIVKIELRGLFAVSALLLSSTAAHAQASKTEQLAQQWRASRLADLQAEKARIEAEIANLPDNPPALDIPNAQPMKIVETAAIPHATAPVAKAAPALAPNEQPAVGESGDEPPTGRQNFGGLDLGVGLSFTMDLGKLNRISRASVVNGIVRSDDQDNGRARIMLESHYFFTPCTWNFLGLKNPCKGDEYLVADPKEARWGIGPFIAVQPGSDNIIDAIGLGIMIGARREKSAQSFNLGIGVVFDPNTRVLGDGIRENEPLPAGETEVRYRETLQTGLLVLTSFSF